MPSGIAFRQRRGAPNWDSINSAPSIDDILSSSDLSPIQDLLDTLTFTQFKTDNLPLYSPDLMVKTLKYMQLTIEYLLNVQESLSAAVGRAKDELSEERLLVEELRTNERVQDRKCRSMQKQCRQFQSTLQAASRMLANVGVDTTALRRMSEEAFADPVGTSSEYVWVPAYMDPYDHKAFQSPEYLKKHMFRKHGKQLIADINSGFYGIPGGDIRVNHGSDESHMVTFSVKKSGMKPEQFIPEKQEELRQHYATYKSVDKERIALSFRSEERVHDDPDSLEIDFVISDFPTAIDAEDFADRCAEHEPLGKEYLHFAPKFVRKPRAKTASKAMGAMRTMNAFNASIRNTSGGVDGEGGSNVAEVKPGSRTDPTENAAISLFNIWKKGGKVKRSCLKELACSSDDFVSLINLDREFLREPLTFLDPGRVGGALTVQNYLKSSAIAWEAGPPLEHWTAIDSYLRTFKELDQFLKMDLATEVQKQNAAAAKHELAMMKQEKIADLNEEIQRVFKKLDADGSGSIDQQEFIDGITKDPQLLDVIGIDCSDPTERAAVLDGFREIDNDGGGDISLDELKHFIQVMRSFKTGFTIGQARGLEIGNAAASEALETAKANMASMAAANEEAMAAAAAGMPIASAEDQVETLHELDCDPEIIHTFMEMTNDNGHVSMNEFFAAIQSRQDLATSLRWEGHDQMSLDHALTIWRSIDTNNDEYITLDQLSDYLEKVKLFSDGYKNGLDPDALVNAQYHTGATRLRGASDQMDFQSTGGRTNLMLIDSGGVVSGGGGGGGHKGGVQGGLSADLDEIANDTPEEKARKRALKAEKMAASAEEGDFWFELNIIGALGIRAGDKKGSNPAKWTSDPIAIVYVGNEERYRTKSKAQLKTLNPHWSNEKARLKIDPSTESEAASVTIKLWDEDAGLITGYKPTDFLGQVQLTKEDLFKHVGAGTVNLRLVNGTGPGEDIASTDGKPVTGTLEFSLHAFANISVTIQGGHDLAAVDKKHPSSDPYCTAFVPGCEILKDAKKASGHKKKEHNDFGKEAKDVHQWSTKSIAKTTNPEWKEKRTLRVPLDREFEATFEVLDKNKTMFGTGAKSISMGHVVLTAEQLLTPTTIDLGQQLTRGGEQVQGKFYKGWLYPAQFEVQALPGKDAPAGNLGYLDLVIDAPRQIAAMHSRIAAKNAYRPRCPGLGTMEVELSVLRASNLAKAKECYAKVELVMDEGEDVISLGQTGMSKEEHAPKRKEATTSKNPLWDASTKNKFVIAIPFPSNWMEAKPKTQVWIQLFDKQNMTTDSCMGEVRLTWDQLVQPSLLNYELERPPDKSGNGGAGSGDEDDGLVERKGVKKTTKKVQGTMTLRLRQLQAVEIYLLGAYGLCPRDSNGKSDPFVEVTCHSGGIMGGVAGEGESDAQIDAEAASGAAAESASSEGGNPEMIVTETQRAKKARTPYIKKTLSPHWFHKILLTRALNPGTKDIKANSKEKQRRIRVLEEKFGITTYKDANGKPRDWHDHVMDAAMSFDREDNLSVRLTLFDHDDMGGPQFLGMVDLPPSMILDRANQGGVLRLPLKDDMRQKKRVDVSGYIEIEIMVGAYLDDRAGKKPTAQPLDKLDLSLTVNKAEKIASADANGFSDPIVYLHGKNVYNPQNGQVVEFLPKFGKTSEKRRTLNPEWNEMFNITLPSKETADDGYDDGEGGAEATSVVLQLYDHDRVGSDDFLGECRVGYRELLEKDPPIKKLMITNTDGKTGAIKPSKKQFDWLACKSIDAIDFEKGDLGHMFINTVIKSSVEVFVLEAFGLKAVNSGAKDSDPQLVLYLSGLKDNPLEGIDKSKKKRKKGGPEVYKSAVQYRTLEPEFCESFSFSVPTANNEEVELVINMHDSGMTKQTFMGQVRIPAATLLDPPPKPLPYALYDDPTANKPTSGITGFVEIYLRSSYLPEFVKDNLPRPKPILPPPPRSSQPEAGLGADQTYIEDNSSVHEAHGETGFWSPGPADESVSAANHSAHGILFDDHIEVDDGEAVEHDVATTAGRARSQSVDEGGGPSYGEVDVTPRDERRQSRTRSADGVGVAGAAPPGVREHIKGLNHGLGFSGVKSPPLPPRTRSSPRASARAPPAATAAPDATTAATRAANAERARAAALAMKRATATAAGGVEEEQKGEGGLSTPPVPRRHGMGAAALPKRQSPPLPRR